MSKHLKLSLQRIRRAPYQTGVALSVMVTSLFLACVFSLVAVGSQVILRYFESRPQVSAYFKTDYVPTEGEITSLTGELNSTGKVSSVKYVSKENALEIYKNLNQGDPLLLEAVTAQMLPASVEVSAIDPRDLKLLADILAKHPNIDEVSFAEDIIDALNIWTRSVRIIGLVLVGSLLLNSFLVVLLIVGIKVASRRDEIGTMDLLGASKNFITTPFVIEGIIYGSVGGLIAWLFSYILLLYATPFLVTFLSGLPVLPVPFPFMLLLLGGVEILGSLVGGLGGFLACRRFFKS